MTYYEKVETLEQYERFNAIWKPVFKGKFETDDYEGEAERYILLNEDGHDVASIEIALFNPDPMNLKKTTLIEDMFSFSTIPQIGEHRSRCWEIDKIAIKPEFQRTGAMDLIMSLLFELGEERKPKYLLGLIDPLFARMLRFYKVPCKKLGETIEDTHLAYKVIPILIDAEKALRMKEEFSWLETSEKQLL